MWVKRSGFYIENKELCRKDVWIEWNMDTPKEDLYIYIGRIKEALGFELNPIVDTTAYSTNYLGKKLNPYWNKIDNEPCIKVYEDFKSKCDAEGLVPGVFEYLYYLALDDSSLRFIQSMKCFTNIFYNPDKSDVCEAQSCALLKLLILQNKLDYIRDIDNLIYWCYCNIGIMNIISAGDKPVEKENNNEDY